MAGSKAPTVDAYIAEAAFDRAEALARIREFARRTLTGFDETMAHGMPTFSRDGQPQFAFASQKAHLSLYFMNAEAVAACADALVGHDMGKGCLRFRKADAVDYAVVEQLLAATRDSSGPTSAC
jgi:uncharacterized protein YdhG (YjbR/CyaY superfamily)